MEGGKLKYEKPYCPPLRFLLWNESRRNGDEYRWSEQEAVLYAEIGANWAEYHANWGV